jgi:spermidine synthase
LADARIRVVATDGRRFVRQTPERYDVVIVAVPDPSTSQLNRFYTQEFFRDIAARLTPEGVLCLAVGRYVNYLSDELSQLIAVTHRTLREQFPNVLLLPAGKIFYLASAGPLTADVAGSIEQQGLRNRLVNRHYLKAMLTQDRLEAVNRALSDTAPRNRDFSPILYYCHLRYWMSQFRVRFGVLEGGLLLVLLISLCRARPVSFAVFTAGMAASGLEVVLLMGLQILSGCLYHQVSLLVTMFMIGLGLGSYTMNRSLTQWTRRDLVWLALVMAALAASLPWLLLGLGQIASVAVQAVAAQGVILLLTLVLAGLVGLMFPLAGKIDFRTVSDTAARIYTADYLGAALGALLVSTWLIPMCGVAAVCLGLAVLSLVSGGVVYWTRYDP